MKSCFAWAVVVAIVAVGCRGEKTPVSTNGGQAPPVVEDGSGTGGGNNGKKSKNGDSGAQVVTPTADDSAERKQAAGMDVPALINALGDANPKLAEAASVELSQRGSQAVDPLIAALDSKNPQVQQKAIYTLGHLGKDAQAAVPKLKAIAQSKPSDLLASSAANAIDAIEGN
jgi:hypothetical protein